MQQTIRDMRGVTISVNDVVAYGRSNKDDPINIGIVKRIDEDYIYILGKGNTKEGKIPHFHAKRIIVLPDDYLENV